MCVYSYFRLVCTNCQRDYDETGETITEVRTMAKRKGWVFKKVPNGSYWDFCPTCESKGI